ncbi:MAG: DUF5668 domain-containing protein [Reichenbachiella sp.]|uniref:LiaF transmembrane domain-containing protein n=1 Tax=Reichenbachiella sp. TaxID=2184521 RepID=UPI0029663349|nr:DUF5668 domain-containing protein [Reichenbachiella sp.]MDW3208570.1 DUF5668 domain-containing protein [Reichenbachiella sp.]
MTARDKRTSLGAIFILIGVLFLLDNLGLLPWEIPYYFFTWQMVLVLIGVYQFLSGNARGGLFFIALGLIFWLPEYFNVRFKDYWPVVLIAVGVGFLIDKRKN